MRYLIIVLFGWLSTNASIAQTITVTDASSGLPLEGVVLSSATSQTTIITDARGRAELAPFAGDTLIELRTLGYEVQKLSYAHLKSQDFRIPLTPARLQLSEVVVAASRWPQRSHEIAVKVRSVLPAEVSLQQPQTAADLLGISGQVFVQKSQQGGGSPMIRGFSANRLLYTVDGVRMNTAIFRSGNLQNVINLDPFATERTEVRFGPGSVLYGSDAIGGAMSFTTLTPQLATTEQMRTSGTGVARYASANAENTVHFDFNLGGARWATLTSFSSWDFDHLRQGQHGPDDYLKPYYVQRQDGRDVLINQDDPLRQIPSAYAQVNLMQKLRFQPSPQWDLRYAFHYSETSPYGRYDRHNRRRAGTARYAEWDYGPQGWSMHLLSAQHDHATLFYDQLSLRLARQTFGESRISRDLNDPERRTQEEAVTAWSANLDLTKTLTPTQALRYGLEYVYDEVQSSGELTDLTNNSRSAGPARYPAADWRSWAAYALYSYRPSEQLGLEAGLRYNYLQLAADFRNNLAFYPFPFQTAELAEGAWTGSLGIHYHPGAQWVARASVGTAFRAPNVDDIGKVFDSEPGAVVIPNPELRAEYAYNAEVGISRAFGQHLSLEASAYYTWLDNALVRRPYRLNGLDSIRYEGQLSQVQAIQNAASARVYGWQASMRLLLSPSLTFTTDINYQYGEEELDDGSSSPSRHAAPPFGVSRLQYRSGSLEGQIYLQYQGERSHAELAQDERGKDEIYAKDAAGNNYAPAWYTLNLKARYAFENGWRLSTGLENITDQRYRPYSSGISGAGRQVILALELAF